MSALKSAVIGFEMSMTTLFVRSPAASLSSREAAEEK